MHLFITNPVTLTSTPEFRVWMTFEDLRGEWIAELFAHARGGIHHATHWYRGERPTLTILRRDVYRGGTWSPRPYEIGQRGDSSTTSCVLALFAQYCTTKGLQPVEVMSRIYPAERIYVDHIFADIREQAMWEGVSWPATWDESCIRSLIESLHDIQHAGLAQLIESMAQDGAS